MRTATFMIGDEKGIVPSNVDQGYILRRLIRRVVRHGAKLSWENGNAWKIASVIIDIYKDVYPELFDNKSKVHDELNKEEAKFAKTLQRGLKEFEKVADKMENGAIIDGKTAFRLYDTFGFPIELTVEMAEEKGYTVDVEGFDAAFKEHQAKSSAGSDQKFKGGLADSTEATSHLHTATHLLHAALREMFGDTVEQMGSNITPERLRFDFSFARKVEKDECDKIEDWINGAIDKKIPIIMEEMSVEDAKEAGAIGLFAAKYGTTVKVYSIEGYSKEICGGPHAENTGDLGRFEIQKEQSSASGVRRIKAVLIKE